MYGNSFKDRNEILRSQDNSYAVGPQVVSSLILCSQPSQLRDLTTLLGLYPDESFPFSKNGNGTTSLGSLFHALTVLMVKKDFLRLSLNFAF